MIFIIFISKSLAFKPIIAYFFKPPAIPDKVLCKLESFFGGVIIPPGIGVRVDIHF